MFRTHIAFEADAICLDEERVPFAMVEDAEVQDYVLVLKLATGERRIKLKQSDAMTVLDAVLDGIERAHPHEHPYRAASAPTPEAGPPPRKRMRRVTASSGASNLMIGRTFTAG